jgi:hypothetical protein
MKELPILYNTDMVLAKLDGRKTVTRRPINVPSGWRLIGDSRTMDVPRPAIKYDDRIWFQWAEYFASGGVQIERCPWKPGDILYSRETWAKKFISQTDYTIHYAAGSVGYKGTWRPSIHMRKEYARIWERVVSVRAERLQDITEEDAIKEGAQYFKDLPIGPITPITSDPNRWSMESPQNTDQCLYTARMAFANVWQKIYGTWDDNPFVWVITTEILSTTGRPKDI